jgi:nucleotide-binding universal stress UspA family protein
MKILLAVDGSATTKRMLATLAAHDEMLGHGHQYTALTVVTPIPGRAAAFLSRDTIDGWYQEQADEVLNPVRAFAAQNGWDFEARHLVGHPGDRIAELCQEGKFDLVVMGTHGHSSIANVVMGSVATRVLALVKKPVLLVP